MTKDETLLEQMMEILRDRYGDRINNFLFPPPIFELIQGELLEVDLEIGLLTARFPVLASYQNPYRAMQGGMIATAVDNTLGPLSVLVAPPNVTRTLEMKYSRPATLEMGTIIVKAKLVDRNQQRLFFEADVRNPNGEKLARAKATHWIAEKQTKI